MVGLHHHGRFYEFVPWKARVGWQVSAWGCWQVWAETADHAVELLGRCQQPGVNVQVPIATGMAYHCRDTTHGELSVRLWRLRGSRRQLLLEARSDQAGLEVGGADWDGPWGQ